MNSSLRLLFLGALVFSFTQAGADFSQCKDLILKNATIPSNPNFTPVFVNANGSVVTRNYSCTSGDSYPCGVNYKTCLNYCGSGSTPPKWTTFSSQISAFFLPYFAFVAQLPFRALTTWDYTMSVLLMMGSPALAAYSLILSFFGTRWLQKQCAGVIDRMPESTPDERAIKSKLTSIFDNMKNVLCLAQQEPYENLHFDQPPNIDAEVEWWRGIDEIVQMTKFRFSASFFHQILWVNLAFAFAIADAFGSERVSTCSWKFP